jgi:hypothetical protein
VKPLAVLASALAFVWMAEPATACTVDAGWHGVVFDRVPDDLPANVIVLDVAFDEASEQEPEGFSRIVEARVRSVVRGEFPDEIVRVALPNDTCTKPFLFGTEGLIVGELRQGYSSFDFGGRRLRTGHAGTWFEPTTESLQSRYDRGGPVPFAPTESVRPRG